MNSYYFNSINAVYLTFLAPILSGMRLFLNGDNAA